MADTTIGKGYCLCGKVKITAPHMGAKFGACHCRMCRRWTGGPLLAVDCGNDVRFEGEDEITVFDSSDWAERGFCKHCGTHLFYRLKEPNQYIMPVGIFDNEENFIFDSQVFIDQKPSYYCFSNRTNDMTRAEVFAMYGAPE